MGPQGLENWQTGYPSLSTGSSPLGHLFNFAAPSSSCGIRAGGSNDLLSRFPPPPIAACGEQLPPEVLALVPSWEQWMQSCTTMDQYLSRSPTHPHLRPPSPLLPALNLHPFQTPGSARERMDQLWLRHQQIWGAV